jgi:hypothetical protein
MSANEPELNTAEGANGQAAWSAPGSEPIPVDLVQADPGIMVDVVELGETPDPDNTIDV